MVGHIFSALFVYIALISLSLPSVRAVQQIQRKSLETYIEEVTGRESVVNCGEYPWCKSRSKEALQESLACAEGSTKQQKPFRIVLHVMGTDSFGAYGVLSDATGRAFFFAYDSQPCGGPDCAERFSKKACRLSEVSVGFNGARYRLELRR